MIEDVAFNEFLKAKLEEDIGELPSVKMAEACCSECHPTVFGSRFARPMLWAASLLAICGMMAVHYLGVEKSEIVSDTERVIDLLDDDMVTSSSVAFAERLLAWQDAPYEEILD